MQTFINLPDTISDTTTNILSRSDARALGDSAKQLHERYMLQDKGESPSYIRKPNDALAYLSLRFPATYAQISSTLLQIKDRVPDWKPASVLDLGSGPGTGILAATSVWPDIKMAVGLEQEASFLSLAEEIFYDAKLPVDIKWEHRTIANWIASPSHTNYDLIIIANVLNELPKDIKESFFAELQKRSSGIVLMLEPGTPRGFGIIQSAAKQVMSLAPLIGPYINNTFVPSDEYWIHFPQRFQRPEYQRRIRQSMRESELMASDWEETKYSYVAWGKVPMTHKAWGQSIGEVQRYHGYLIIPVLTAAGIVKARVMKRHKAAYAAAKNIRWGELIEQPMETI